MQEVFYEESAKIQKEKSAKTKYMIFKIMAIISWVFLVVWLILAFYQPIFEGNVLLNIIFILIPAALFITSGILLGKFKNRFYVDFDYTFISGEVRISKVIKEIKRRPVMRFSTSAIEKIGKYGSDTFNNYANMQGIKKFILTSNISPADGKDFYYFVVNIEEKKLLIFECTETLIVNILKFSNKSIIEKDFK